MEIESTAAAAHAFGGYEMHAWGHDELRPLTNTSRDNWGALSVTMVDSLDTLLLMVPLLLLLLCRGVTPHFYVEGTRRTDQHLLLHARRLKDRRRRRPGRSARRAWRAALPWAHDLLHAVWHGDRSNLHDEPSILCE